MTMENNISAQKNKIFDFIFLLLRWKKFIILNFIILVIIGSVISFMLPKIYYSWASVLPPKEETSLLSASGFSGLSSVMKEFSSIKGIGSLGNRNTYNYLVILNSRNVFESVIKKFNLIELYKVPDNSVEKTIKALSENVVFEIQEEGNLVIGVYDEDPNRAADIANYFVEQLNQRSYELNVLESGNNRAFLEKRVSERMDSLTVAENRLKEYQKEHGIYTIPEQSLSMISATAKLFADKTQKEIEINYLNSIVTPDNKFLESAKMQLSALNEKIDKLPDLGLDYLRLYREVYISTKVLEYIRPMLEQVIYQEKKSTPVVVVVDNAKPAEYKVKPKRMIIVGSVGLGSILISILFIVLIERWRKFKLEYKVAYEKMKGF
jgi:tyrosine-protein kinase Etk/Wzc